MGTFDWASVKRGLIVFGVATLVVGAVVGVTLLTGGSATPVVVGAAIGLVTSGVISAGSQWIMDGEIDWGKVLTDASIGMVMGAFGGSGVNQIGMAIAGGASGFSGSVAGDWVGGNAIDFKKAAMSGAMGAIIGFGAGPGAQHGQMGGRQAALATKKEILNKNAAGGYKSANNFNFGLKSNAGRIARETSMLNQTVINSIFKSIGYNVNMGVYQALFSMNYR